MGIAERAALAESCSTAAGQRAGGARVVPVRRSIPAFARSSPSSDGGFSFVELLVALTLLLVTIVAVMGLARTSSFMAGAARQRAAMVNAGAGYLDRVRQMSYDQIGTASSTPTGTLTAVTTTSTPYVITVTPSVAPGPNAYCKTVTLAVASSLIGDDSPMTYSVSAVLADVGAVGSSGSTLATPTVAMVTPTDGSVVWGSASVTASATASSPANPLVWMTIIDGVTSWGSVAVSGVTAQNTWPWNTASAREGIHRLTPRVTDSGNTVANGTPVNVTVDNLAPSAPGALGSSWQSGSTAQVWWTGATDGTDFDGLTALAASHYVVNTYVQPQSTALASDYTKWTAVTGLTNLSILNPPTSGSPLTLSGLAGFSRYGVAVSASSPDRGATPGLTSAPITSVGITEPTLTGTWVVTSSSNKYTVNVSFSVPVGPTFPWTGTATVKYYRLTSAAQSITSGTLLKTVTSPASPTWIATAATDTQSSVSAPTRYWYAAQVTLTPNGYGSAATTVNSSVLAAPASLTTVGTQQLVFAQW